VTAAADLAAASATTSRRRVRAALASTALLLGGAGLTGCTAPASTGSTAAAGPSSSTVSTEGPWSTADGVQRPDIAFALPPAGSSVVVFGDSYTEATGATQPRAGYAAQLAAQFDWAADVEGVGGTGFVARGAVDADYLDRLAGLTLQTPALVVVQGGLNDALAGVSEQDELAAARQVLALLRHRLPDTEVVVLGPPAVQVVDAAVVSGVDRALRQASLESGAPYLSPLAEGWAVERYTTADGLHPDDRGHEYLAGRVASALRHLAH